MVTPYSMLLHVHLITPSLVQLQLKLHSCAQKKPLYPLDSSKNPFTATIDPFSPPRHSCFMLPPRLISRTALKL